MTSDTRTIFGQRLRQARKWADLAQDKLGIAIGLTEGTSSARISRYETGVHEPSIATARLLAEQLDVPLAFLYCDDDDMALMLLGMHDSSRKDRIALVVSTGWKWPNEENERNES